MSSNVKDVIYSVYRIRMSDYRIISADENFEKLTGYTEKDYRENQLKHTDLIPAEDIVEYIEKMMQIRRNQNENMQEHRLVRKNGDIIVVFCYGKIYKDEKTGELVLVNQKAYKVAKDGSVSLTFKGEGTYVVKTQAEVKAEAKQIAKTVKPAKTTVNVATKKTTVFKWNKKLNMENVAKITYKSSKKSVVSVNKNGKITGKKKGTGKVTAEVTLKDGTKKTVKMKVKVK